MLVFADSKNGYKEMGSSNGWFRLDGPIVRALVWHYYVFGGLTGKY